MLLNTIAQESRFCYDFRAAWQPWYNLSFLVLFCSQIIWYCFPSTLCHVFLSRGPLFCTAAPLCTGYVPQDSSCSHVKIIGHYKVFNFVLCLMFGSFPTSWMNKDLHQPRWLQWTLFSAALPMHYDKKNLWVAHFDTWFICLSSECDNLDLEKRLFYVLRSTSIRGSIRPSVRL